MSITSLLYKAARFSASVRAVNRAASTGSMWPIFRRILNIAIGRNLFSRLTIRK